MKSHQIFWTSLALVCVASASFADRAVVVGINKYPAFPSDRQLAGAASDATMIAASLKSLGFVDPVLIMDEKATKAGIKAAIDSVASISKPTERFVFFFAGHGWRDDSRADHVAIVPYDANQTPNTLEILPSELSAWIQGVPASSRSIILDSCFSGAMTGARNLGRPGLRARSLPRPGSKGGFQTGNSRDLQKVFTRLSDNNTTFFAACSPEQLAYERVFGDKPQGIFTKHLLDAMRTQPQKWDDVVRPVAESVNSETRLLQSPMIVPANAVAATFLGRQSNDPTPGPVSNLQSLWDQIVISASQSDALEISSSPNVTSHKVGDQLKIKTVVRKSGYLVLFNKGTSGTYYVRFPENLSGTREAVADRAHIEITNDSEGKIVPKSLSLPGPDEQGRDQSFEPDQTGTEQIKAVLYESRDEFLKVAELIKNSTDASNVIDTRSQKSRDFRKVITRFGPGTEVFSASLQLTIEPKTEEQFLSRTSAPLMAGQPSNQRRLGMGWKPSTTAQVRSTDKLVARAKPTSLPASILLTKYLPPVLTQGGQGSCTAWAAGYYTYTYGLNEGRQLQPDKLGEARFAVSPSFIYNQINSGIDRGAYIHDAVKILTTQGAASMEEAPYDEFDHLSQPSEEAKKAAIIDKSPGAYLIGGTTSFVVSEVKQYLAEVKLPLVFAMPVHRSFQDLYGFTGVYNGVNSASDKYVGGHAMCIIGYDDSKKAFRVVNSWGKDWGDAGFVWISYDHLAKVGRDDWAIIPGGIRSRGLARLNSSRFTVKKGQPSK